MIIEPKVTVVIPTNDRPAHLRRAIMSVRRQNYNNVDIVVVNDGALRLKHLPFLEGVKLLEGHVRSKVALGYGSGGYTRNLGISAANGEFISFLDDDDQFEPHKIRTQVKMAVSNQWRALCSDSYIGILPVRLPFYCQLHSRYYAKELLSHLKPLGLTDLPREFDAKILRAHNTIITSTTFIARDLLFSAGGFNNIASGGQVINGIKDYEDWDLWRRISNIGVFHYDTLPLAYYKRGSIKKLKARLLRNLAISPAGTTSHRERD